MRYISTRGGVSPIEFQDAVLMGLADDGGLIVPESIPDASGELERWRRLPYDELAYEVLRLYASDMPEADLRELVVRTYSRDAFDPAPAPTVSVGSIHVLELWHGPTLAFKDIALQLLGNLFEYILHRRGGRLNILGATSGDTGSAAIAGCRGRRGIDIFIMHPRGRVSPIQQRQMTTVLDDNVHNIAVEGSFDDCQRIMKQIAGDLDFKRRHSLGAVNSVNWARVLAQIVYYFRAAFDAQAATGAERVRVTVPTGNFGDVLAGWYALKMGAPISLLILATNVNDILARFYNTGVYALGSVVQTTSPSMDIQVASNFERYLYYKVGCDGARLRTMMSEFARTGSLSIEPGPDGVIDADFLAGTATEEQVFATIRKYHQEHGYLLDPHTAVGVTVAENVGRAAEPAPLGLHAGEPAASSRARQTRAPYDPPIVCLATAHPAKFPDAIKQATGEDLARHPAIDALAGLPTRCEVLPNDTQAVRQFIERTV
ncbi:MAG TPA: threonine synthase [Phycisphaerae bacterium]|nr:threonine synthase [Phycisphaerae bacterium]